MKKLIILLAAAMITGMTLVSCGGGSMSADEKAELISNVKQAIAASRSADMDKAVIAIGVDSTAGVSVTDTVAANRLSDHGQPGRGQHIQWAVTSPT